MTTPAPPAPLPPPSWPYCGDGATAAHPVGCRGRRVDPHLRCLAHLDPVDRLAYLTGLAPGDDVDHRGTAVDDPLLTGLLDAVRDPATGHSRFGTARFDGATFTGDARFDRATFTGDAGFDSTTFMGIARFGGGMFTRDAVFSSATFTGIALFGGATFTSARFFEATFSAEAGFGDVAFSSATFDRTTFSRSATFSDATFTGHAGFDRVRFRDDVAFDRTTFIGYADFNGADFGRTAEFAGVTFSGDAGFGDTTFFRTARFDGAMFSGEARFGRATFSGDAWFRDMAFSGDAMFGGATFDGEAVFIGATFSGKAVFASVCFSKRGRFGDTKFTSDARFSRATFSDDALFGGATFSGDAWFDRVTISGDAVFVGATFLRASALGPLVCTGTVELSGARFEPAATVEIAAVRVACRRTTWEQTAKLRLRYADLDLTDAVLTQPLAVTARPEPFPRTGAADALHLGGNPQTVKVTSVSGVDAAFLSLTDTDLSQCRFAGTFHLDQLRLEGRTLFAAPPTAVRWRRGIPQRWTRRRTLAEEHAWRALELPPASPAAPTPSEWTPGPDHPNPRLTPGPDDVAPVYRALRKAFEDGKNEPGAADFYYGEMSMRRVDRLDTTRAERALLTAYWALSGYGLRASRALGWLLAAMTATVLAMMLWGLPTHDPKPHTTGTQVAPGQRVDWVTDNPDPALHGSYGSRFTAERAEKATRVVVNSVIFRSSGQNLTTAGTYIEMTSRFTEPVLLALAALAIRGRVKR